MKSMKLFKKDKTTKKIVWNFLDEKNINYPEAKDDSAFLGDKIYKMNQEVSAKRNKLNILKKELDCLNTVLNRNKRSNDEIEESKKIYFPFIIIEFPENLNTNDSKVIVAMNENKTQAHFAFDSANKLYGDLDAILKIGSNIANPN